MKLDPDEQQALSDATTDTTVPPVLDPAWLDALGTVRRALELGAGDAGVTHTLAGQARSLTCMVDDPQGQARLQETAAAAGLTRVQVVLGAEASALPASSFDLIVAVARPLEGPSELASALALARPDATWWLRLPIGHDPSGWPADADVVDPTSRRVLGVVRQVVLPGSGGGLWWCEAVDASSIPPAVQDAAMPPEDSAPATALPLAAGADPCDAVDPTPVPTLADLAAHQDRQSEVLLNIGQFLCHLGERLQAIEARLDAPASAPVPAMPAAMVERLDRLESTLHWSTRQPRGRTAGAIRVIFLVHHAAAWPAVRGVVDAMREDRQFEPVIVSIPHRFPMLARMGGEQEVHDMLQAQGYPHVRVPDAQAEQALERLKQLNPQVVFRQAPWDADVPACLHAQHLAFTRVCYVPYGYLTAAIERHQFDQPLHRLAWRIFCPDDAHRELYAQHNQLGGSNCRVTGFPKFDHLLNHVGGAGHWPVAATRQNRFRLLWAPHFSYTGPWLRFGVFDRIAATMLELAGSRPDLEIVLRPHPAMREAMASAAGDSFLGRFRDRWAQLPNVGLSLEQEYADLFAASQAMLTDGLSFLSEYQFFDKPLVFFEREDNVGFNAAGAQLLQGLYRVKDMDTFAALLTRLEAGREDAAIASARRAVVAAMHPYPNEAARRIVDVIRREIDQP